MRHAIRLGKQFLFPFDRKRELKDEFERMVLPQISHLYTVAFYLTRDKAEAEDLVQETCLRAFRFFDQFQPGTNCRAWLKCILGRLFINRCRQKRREPETMDLEKIGQVYESIGEEREKAERMNPESLFSSMLKNYEIEEALRGLPEKYRTAVIFVDIEELSYKETAKVMGCPLGTIRSRVSRGHRILQVALRDCR